MALFGRPVVIDSWLPVPANERHDAIVRGADAIQALQRGPVRRGTRESRRSCAAAARALATSASSLTRTAVAALASSILEMRRWLRSVCSAVNSGSLLNIRLSLSSILTSTFVS